MPAESALLVQYRIRIFAPPNPSNEVMDKALESMPVPAELRNVIQKWLDTVPATNGFRVEVCFDEEGWK